MADLKTQLTLLGAHIDDTAARIDAQELTERIRLLERTALRPRVNLRPSSIGLIGAAAVLVLVGAVPLTLYLLRSDGAPPVGDVTPIVTVAPSPPPVTTVVVPPATKVPGSTQVTPPIGDAATAELTPWQEHAAETEPVATLDTPLGALSWYTRRSVSYEWVEAGFPGPSGAQPDREFWKIWGDTHSGLEVFETGAGYVGLGSTTQPDEPRIMLGYRDNLMRVRGAATRADVERQDAQEGVDRMEVWSSGTWIYWDGTFNSFSPAELWFSEDGLAWNQIDEFGVGADAAMVSRPSSVAERDGTWTIIGWNGVAEVDDVADLAKVSAGFPTAWMSDNLRDWVEVPIEFGANGAVTYLDAVVAGDDGWMIVEKQPAAQDTRTSIVVWMSADGSTWHEMHIHELTSTVGCPLWTLIREGETCILDVTVSFIPGGIAVYVHHPDSWTLWVGLWDD
jgi:hypothetical protein